MRSDYSTIDLLVASLISGAVVYAASPTVTAPAQLDPYAWSFVRAESVQANPVATWYKREDGWCVICWEWRYGAPVPSTHVPCEGYVIEARTIGEPTYRLLQEVRDPDSRMAVTPIVGGEMYRIRAVKEWTEAD